MGFPAYLKESLLTSSVSISSSTEDSSYPHEYLFDTIAALPFRFTATTGGHVEIDFLVAVQPTMLAILNHNFSSGVTLSLKAGAAANPSTLVATPLYREGDLYAVFNAGGAFRYWRLTVTDSGSANTEIGELYLGAHIALPAVRRPGNHSPAVRENKINMETERGVKWIYDLFKREERNFLFRLRTSQLSGFRDFHDAVGGSASPFVFVPDLDGAEVFYVRKEESFEPDELEALPAGGGMVFDYMLKLTEESHGAAVAA